MKSFHAHGPRAVDPSSTLRRGLAWIMANSLVVYLAASQLQRVWLLLHPGARPHG